MRHQIALSALVMFALSGCVTIPPVPEDVGVGRYLHYYTRGGLMVMQGNYRHAADCEINLRGHWAENFKAGFSAKCSEMDRSRELPYGLLVNAAEPGTLEVTALLMYSSVMCERLAEGVPKDFPNIKFTKYCTTPFEIAQVEKAAVATASSAREASVEDQLKELKRLFDAGLVSKAMYGERQKKILESIK